MDGIFDVKILDLDNAYAVGENGEIVVYFCDDIDCDILDEGKLKEDGTQKLTEDGNNKIKE